MRKILSPLLGKAAICAAYYAIAAPAVAQQDFSKVEIKTTQLADGVFLIDDLFASLSEKIQAAIAAISDQPVKYVLNTHWHGDHTGGNENFGTNGAVIVSHENVRKRLSTKQFMKAFGREVPAGKSREQVIDSNPLAPLNEQWGNRFMKPEVFTGIVFEIESGT